MTGSRAPLLVLLVASLAGCTHAIPLKPTLEQPPAVRQVPIAVGVYYSPEFREYRHVGSRMGDRWDFAVGPASVTLLDRALSMIFESVVPVAGRPPLAGGPGTLAGVIEPAIEEFDFSLPFLKTGTYSAEIAYRFTVFSPGGEPVAAWSVRGRGDKPGQMGFEFARWPGEAADLAMQDAAMKLVQDFGEVPEVRLWLRRLGVPGAWLAPALPDGVARKE